MDPLSISASVLAIITAAITTVKALNETVGRYKGRDKTLGRLQGGLIDLISILKSLEEVANEEISILTLLKGPISRCTQVSRDFEDAMKTFSAKSKTGLKDWAKMEFMRGDINEFIDTLADYKSTIMIGLGTVTMHSSKITQQVVEEYNEMVKDTAYNLDMRLQRIDEKMNDLTGHHSSLLEDSGIDLQNEKAVTMQCLRICERASAHIESLQDGQPTLQNKTIQQRAGYILDQFDAQVMTQKTLNENRENLVETIGRLRERLDSMMLNGGSNRDSQTILLQEEINYSKQCLEVCKEASNQVSSQKIHIIGEVIAEEDCDQVVVTTLADLFSVGLVKSKGRSMQLVGSMPAETLREMSKDRYSSRFGAVGGNLTPAQMDNVTVPPSTFETQSVDSSSSKSKQVKEDMNSTHSKSTHNRPSSNEMRKRRAGGENGAN